MSAYGRALTEREKTWWGKAVPRSGSGSTRFHVDRYADYAAAVAAAADTIVAIPERLGVPSETPGVVTEALVCSQDNGQTWYFSELGWVVPT